MAPTPPAPLGYSALRAPGGRSDHPTDARDQRARRNRNHRARDALPRCRARAAHGRRLRGPTPQARRGDVRCGAPLPRDSVVPSTSTCRSRLAPSGVLVGAGPTHGSTLSPSRRSPAGTASGGRCARRTAKSNGRSTSSRFSLAVRSTKARHQDSPSNPLEASPLPRARLATFLSRARRSPAPARPPSPQSGGRAPRARADPPQTEDRLLTPTAGSGCAWRAESGAPRQARARGTRLRRTAALQTRSGRGPSRA
jgi:hypothetical protein